MRKKDKKHKKGKQNATPVDKLVDEVKLNGDLKFKNYHEEYYKKQIFNAKDRNVKAQEVQDTIFIGLTTLSLVAYFQFLVNKSPVNGSLILVVMSISLALFSFILSNLSHKYGRRAYLATEEYFEVKLNNIYYSKQDTEGTECYLKDVLRNNKIVRRLNIWMKVLTFTGIVLFVVNLVYFFSPAST